MTRIYLTNGYRGKDMREVFYPKGEHDFPEIVAERLIKSGQALALDKQGRPRQLSSAETTRTIEQVITRISDLSDEDLISFAKTEFDISVPYATVRAAVIAAVVEAALRSGLPAIPPTPATGSFLASDEEDRINKLKAAGLTDQSVRGPDDDPMPNNGVLRPVAPAIPETRLKVEDSLELGQGIPDDVDISGREFTVEILRGYATKLGVTVEKDAKKGEIIEALREKK